MASHYKTQPLPKFGEWDVNDPASAEGFTAIFNIARDEKRSGGRVTVVATESLKSQNKEKRKHKHSIKRKWFCFA
ncbi:protein NOI4-like [Hibiscus syriacus]|uniref:protein NOI4-like n=1 Tax=Hibiscus syriacus TaxID=106335 RepID=UPI0019224E8B|nr:protein NOI4-like [Hibiscus syriacus]